MPPETAAEPGRVARTAGRLRSSWHNLTGFLTDGAHARTSLFGEILDWLWVPVMLLMPFSVLLTFAAAKSLSNAPFDRALADSVQVLAGQVQLRGSRVVADLPLPAREILRADDTDTIYFQVVGQRGEFIAGDRDLPQPADDETPAIGEVRYRLDELNGAEVRIAYTWVSPALAPAGASDSARAPVGKTDSKIAGKADGRPDAKSDTKPDAKSDTKSDIRPVLVQVAETLDKRAQLANEIVTGVILPQFFVLPLAVMLIWLGLARGLGPLSELIERIHRRRPGDLSPIDASAAPAELQPLIRSINELMQQLDASLKGQQRFIANAAHQLRTPLAGLKMQTELALRQSHAGDDTAELKRSLAQMALSTERATRMVNQLLALTRAEKAADAGAPAAPQEALDLNCLAEQRVREWVPQALAKRIDLGFDGMPHGAQIVGNELLLAELAGNLIDNAIRYTPAGGVVTVRVRAPGGGPLGHAQNAVMLEVEDNGIGIAPGERELVFERFYRVLGSSAAGANLDGSGLGLSIVREIAFQHRALVRIGGGKDGSGSVLSVTFPAAIPGMAVPGEPDALGGPQNL